jgi:phosphotransferase system  glucose/maltose/N-acetylglucosamine-specific IIC component
MKDKTLSLIIMLTAGFIISLSCFIFKVKLGPSLLIVSATLLVFYIIGSILTKVIKKINADAENRAQELVKEETEKENEEETGEAANAEEEGEEPGQAET